MNQINRLIQLTLVGVLWSYILGSPGVVSAAESSSVAPTQQELWAQIESGGWPASLLAFRQRFQVGKSYVALYKKLPISAMDMRSPNRFKNSMSSNQIASKSSIGHMSIGWSCAEPLQENRLEGFAAQTGESSNQVNEMLESGWGVTAIVSTFTDGEIQNGIQIQKYFSDERKSKIENGKTPNTHTALVVEVPTADCLNVRDFVKSYVSHPSKPLANFGMMPDPEKFEGAGCGSFAVVALSKATSISSLMTTFWRTVELPEKLFGRRTRSFAPNNTVPPFFAKVPTEQYEIGKMKLIVMNWDTGPIAMRLRLVDPELVIFSLRQIIAEAVKQSSQKLSPLQSEQIHLLRRTVNLSDSGFHELDATFDSSFSKVSSTVDQWLSASSAKAQLVTFDFGLGVMIASE